MGFVGPRDSTAASQSPGERGTLAPSYTWAAVLSLVAAAGGVLSAIWGVVAAGLVTTSINSVSEYIPDDAKSAMARLTSLSVVTAVVGVLVAVGFVVGAVFLLRRKPAGRVIVVATCVLHLTTSLAVYGLGRRVWTGIEAALRDVKSVEATYLGPGLASLVWNALLPVVIIVLTLWAPRRPLVVQVQAGGSAVPQANAIAAGGLPRASGRTAVTAAALSLAGGAVFTLGVGAGVIGVLDSGLPEDERIISAIVGALAFPFAVGVILGGIFLLRRRRAARIVLAVMWTLVILFSAGFLLVVVTNPARSPGVLVPVVLVVALVVAYAAAAITLAMVSATARWCDAGDTSRGAVAEAPPPYQQKPIEPRIGANTPEHAPTAPGAASGRKRVWVIAAAGAVVVLAAAGTALAFTTTSRKPNAVMPHSYGPQIVLPFTELSWPAYIAVDAAGTVYVADKDRAHDTSRVLALPVGATAPNTLQVDGLREGGGVAVDVAGTVYVNDGYDGVLALIPGSNAPTKLSFHGTNGFGVAVDTSGTVYVADSSQVRSLAAGDTAPRVLPFVGLDATYVAVDAARTVYVRGRDHKRVLLLRSGSTTQSELPLTGIKGIEGLAVDSEGTLYVADFDGAQVVAFAAGSDTPSVLPITGLRHPSDVAVDATGNVYVSGFGFNDERLVLKLPVAA